MSFARAYLGTVEVMSKSGKYGALEYARIWIGKPDEYLKNLKGKRVVVIVVPLGEQ